MPSHCGIKKFKSLPTTLLCTARFSDDEVSWPTLNGSTYRGSIKITYFSSHRANSSIRARSFLFSSPCKNVNGIPKYQISLHGSKKSRKRMDSLPPAGITYNFFSRNCEAISVFIYSLFCQSIILSSAKSFGKFLSKSHSHLVLFCKLFATTSELLIKFTKKFGLNILQ